MKLLKRIWRSETGLALPIVLLLLLFGGFLVAPTLAFVSTNLNTGIVIEEKTFGFYAADAGIEDCCWDLLQEIPSNFQGEPPKSWTLTDEVNGMLVTLEWLSVSSGFAGSRFYTVRSTGTLDGTKKDEILAVIQRKHTFDFLFERAITSLNDVTLQPGSSVYGDVLYNGSQTDGELDLRGDSYIDGKVTGDQTIIEDWPTADNMSEFYLETVSNPYESKTMNISQLASETDGGLYRVGDLTIEGTGEGTGTGQLCGTIYITGQLVIKPGCTVEMGGHSIYSHYYNDNPQKFAVDFQPGCFVVGPGCVVANGSVNFQPSLTAPSEVEPLFVMSVQGQTNFQPSCTVFYGSLAGDAMVNMQPNSSLTYRGPGGDKEFPFGAPKVTLTNYSIGE